MSVQYGIWNQKAGPLHPAHLAEARLALTPYAPDGIECHSQESVAFLFCPLHGALESSREQRSIVSRAGIVLIWDGRLDNRPELISKLREQIRTDASDADVVAACYRSWGLECFAALLGDWALAIWDCATRSLVLAKDFIGTRQLYYRIEKNQVTWSTVIEALLRPRSDPPEFNFEYLAGCLSFLPAAELTPYKDVFSVPPSSFVRIQDGRLITTKYWDFSPSKTIRYRSDSEYETHFLEVFRESVRRRLRAGAPVLAELSGGMDSSSIVCVADGLEGSGKEGCSILETISYYSSTEPDWDEKPYFVKVEQMRGHSGSHINVGPCGFFRFEFDSSRTAFVPGARPSTLADVKIASFMKSIGSRVLLSGLGGDEFMGGVPTPVPEIADLLRSGNFREMAHKLKVWAIALRKPWLHLFAETVRDFLPKSLAAIPSTEAPAPWIRTEFAKRYRQALLGYPSRITLFRSPPSFQHNLQTVEALRRTLAWSPLSAKMLCERRYPYLDRTLLEFLFAIPREQLVRPGQRRSLMRRALRGIVPPEIVDRRRKAFVSRAPRNALASEARNISSRDFIISQMGLVNRDRLLEEIKNATLGKDISLVPLVRTITLECWLRHFTSHQVVLSCADNAHGEQTLPQLRQSIQKGGELHEI
jgi:asparagine synthase (glutamine-hydrolysing)